MTRRYSKRTVDEAVQLLDVYASQEAWSVVSGWRSLWGLAVNLGTAEASLALAAAARNSVTHGLSEDAGVHACLEAAQRLREGWRP